MPQIENENVTASFVDEVQKEAGYLLRHHTQISTWDERIRLDSLSKKKAGLQEILAQTQDAIAKLDVVISESVAAPAQPIS